MFKLYQDKLVQLYAKCNCRRLGQMTAINSNRCYLKLSFIRKSFENNSQNHFFFTYLSN